MINGELISALEVANILKVTPQQVRTLIRKELLKATRIGKQWVVDKADVESYIRENDIIIEPDDHPRTNCDVPPIVALSFFSGAMGLDIGMKNAGIEALLACENNKACRMTIERNNPDIALIGDIAKYTAKEILEMAKIPEGRNVDIIFGGPPCQAFSTAGSRRGFDDDRGNVFLTYLDIINEIRPTYVVIENVRGLLSTPYPYGDSSEPIKGGAMLIIQERLKGMGYTISFELYNTANFGAPQIRERVVIICKRGDTKVPYLVPTHSDDKKYGLLPWRTLKDAFGQLDVKEHHHIEFPEERLKYYRMLKEGQYWRHLPDDLQKEAMGKSYYLGGGKTGFYRRLAYKKPSPTLVTNPAMPATDLAHPIENRPLSVEEYSCIQEFPKEWKICGSILDQYKQIGNAVPIKLGEAIGKTIINDMRNIQVEAVMDFSYSRYKNTNDITWNQFMEKELQKRKR
ncbi:MAG TPA: DNA cytosine methyltransferase [Patescibacteria group bacterium]|nr:DNA cytosine methyltransferase [Patescibacteria group bacterium]